MPAEPLKGKLMDRDLERFEDFLDILASKIVEKLPREKAEPSPRIIPERPAFFHIFTYPADGTQKTVGAGVVEIDFYTGKVTLPDGTEEHLSDNLRHFKEQYIRSFAINTDQDVVIWSDQDPGKRPVEGGDLHGENWVSLAILYIKTTTSTQLNLWGATHPQSFLSKFKETTTRLVESNVYENFLASVKVTETLPSTEVHSGTKTSSTPGTAVSLGTASCDAVVVKGLTSNSSKAYVGDSNLKQDGFELNAKEAVSISVGKLGSVFIDVDTSGEGVSYLYIK